MKRFFILAVLIGLAFKVISGVLGGTYFSNHGTYYEFFSKDSVIIGNSIEGDVYAYRVNADTLFLENATIGNFDTCKIIHQKGNMFSIIINTDTTYFFKSSLRKMRKR